MSNMTNISISTTYDFDIIELLTNSDQIDDDDDDFKTILEQLVSTSENRNERKEDDIMCRDSKQNSDDRVESPSINESNKVEKSVEVNPQPDNCNSYTENPINSKRAVKEIFPIKLFKILERSEVGGYSHIVSWLEHGRAFKIHNIELFKEQIMKKYFFQTELKSFKHQLYVYGFQKIAKRYADSGAYHHELFVRGRIDLCSKFTRQDGNVSSSGRSICCGMKVNECNKRVRSSDVEACGEPKIVQYRRL